MKIFKTDLHKKICRITKFCWKVYLLMRI